jgi:hypothetical protein
MTINYYVIQKFDSGMHYFLVDERDIKKYLKLNDKRCICNLNNSIDFHCAIMKKKDGGYYINLGLKIMKSLNLKLGDSVKAKFKEDNTEHKFAFSEELFEVLKSDLDASKVFDRLSDGNKRSLIYLISLVKSSDKKIERALKIAEKLKAGITSAKEIMKKQ